MSHVVASYICAIRAKNQFFNFNFFKFFKRWEISGHVYYFMETGGFVNSSV